MIKCFIYKRGNLNFENMEKVGNVGSCQKYLASGGRVSGSRGALPNQSG